jgi:TolB protein
MLRLLRKAILACSIAPLAMGCLASPPGHLPSSVRVLYSRATEDSLGARTDIYFLVARSGNELQLTGEEAVDRQPAFASRLRKVFYTRETAGREEIWSMELDGSGEGVVLAAAGVDFREPAVSPDETQIAYTRNESGRSRVEVAEIDGSNPRALVAKEGSWSQPAWSPDGRTLVVVGADNAVPRLFLVEAAGGEPRPLTTGDAGPQRDPDWSADGTRIVFTRGEGSGAEIAVAAVPGGAVTRLTENDVEEGSPVFSPGGERIVYVSHRPDGRPNLWVMSADGDDAEALTRRDEADAMDPDWL